MDANHLIIDGVAIPIEAPNSVEELANRVERCAREETAVYPIGGGTGLNYGRPPARTGIALSLGKLNRIVDYPVEDLTITVEAGMTVAHIHAQLAGNNQRLPIDVPNPETATVGGAIAINAAGPRRLGHGTWRDWIIGMTIVNDRGELCNSGGRVVKNVAGYDLGKLYTGSIGTLGVITQVTLKLQPRPEAQQWVSIDNVNVNDVGNMLDKIHNSATQPKAVELISTDRYFKLAMLFEDNQESVTWQIEQLHRELAPHVVSESSPETNHQLAERATIAECPLQLIATMRSSQVGDFLKANADGTWKIQAHAMNGVVWLGRDVTQLEEARSFVHRLTLQVSGNVVIRQCPREWKSVLPVWGRPPASLDLMKKVKRELDPKDILNPGRTMI